MNIRFNCLSKLLAFQRKNTMMMMANNNGVFIMLLKKFAKSDAGGDMEFSLEKQNKMKLLFSRVSGKPSKIKLASDTITLKSSAVLAESSMERTSGSKFAQV